MDNYYFGSGAIWTTALQDAFGNKQQNPTPVMVGALQDFSVEFSADLKELNASESQDALAIARGKRSTTGKFKFANLYGEALSTLYLGQAMEDGVNAIVQDTVGHVITSTHSVTVTPPNSGDFTNDLGVVNSSTYVPLTRVASAPATGQYSVTSGGVYTFATADEGNKVYINYNYAADSVGKTVTSGAIKMGPTPSFRLDVALEGPDGQQMILTLYKCVSSKLSIATKFDEFVQPEIEFKAQQDSNKRLFTLSYV